MSRRLLLLLVAAALFPALAFAQDTKKPPVTITYKSLVVGQPTIDAKPRRFVSITTIVTNDTAGDVEGVLKVYRSAQPPAGSGVAKTKVPEQPLFYERALKLPRGGKRTETLEYYCQDQEPDRICIAFEPTSGEAVASWPPLAVTSDNTLLALSVTSRDSDEAARLGNTQIPGPRRPYALHVRRADLSALPERPEGYGPFDLVIVSDIDPRSVNERQIKALTQWVQQGGDLVVAFSGKVAEGLGGLDEAILPVTAAPGEPTEQRDLHDLDALAPDAPPISRQTVVGVRHVVPKKGAQVIAGSAKAPLIVRGRCGAGRVSYFAFELAGLQAWSGSKSVLHTIVRPPSEDLESPGSMSGGNTPPAPPLEESLLNLTEALKQLEPPSALIVGPLLILYVVLVAPLNYYVLSRLGKRDYSMATATGIAVVFAGMFYGIGRLSKGTDALVARASIIDLASEANEPSRIDTMMGFFSTERGLVDGKASAGSAIAPIADHKAIPGARVVRNPGEDTVLRSVELNTWTLQRFRATRTERMGAVVSKLRWDGGRIVGRIENKTKLKIERPVLLMGERCIEIASELAPGAGIDLDGIPQELAQIEVCRRLLEGGLEQRFRPRYGDSSMVTGPDPFGGNPYARLRAAIDRRAAVLTPSPTTMPALLVGVVEGDPGGVDLEAKASLEFARSVVLSEVAIEADSGEIRVVGMIPRVARGLGYEASGGVPGSPALLSSSQQANTQGFVEYEWRIPSSPELPFVPSRLEIAWRFLENPEPDSLTLHVQDWTSGMKARERLNLARGSFVESRPEMLRNYVDPSSGLVRIRLYSSSYRNLGIDKVTLTVTGSRQSR